MPSQAHAVLVNLFRQSQSLTLDLLRTAGVEVRHWQPTIVESTLPVTSADYHVDLAVRCNDEQGSPQLLALVEIQLKADGGKLRTWPLYQAAARAKFGCSACVLVVALEEHVALAHGKTDPSTLDAAITAIAPLEDAQRSRAYFDLLRYHVKGALDRALERLMATTEHKYLSDFARKYYDEGQAQGEAKGLRTALTALFSARRLPLSESGRARIAACADIGTLTQWLERAVSAAAEAEVFGEGVSKGRPRRPRA